MFQQIPIDHYVTILGDLIDFDIVSHLLIGLSQYVNDSSTIVVNCDVSVIDRLFALTLVPGFELAVLFIGENERNGACCIYTHLLFLISIVFSIRINYRTMSIE